MGERIAYFNGEYVSESEVRINMLDRGFLSGDGVFEHSRTFNHQPFRFEEHVARLFRSLRYIDIDIGMNEEQMNEITYEVFRRNEKNLGPMDDYWVRHQVTRGLGFRIAKGMKPTVLIFCIPLPVASVAKFYSEGAHIVTASVRQPGPQHLDPKAKLTSRINHVLADVQVKALDPEAYALLLDDRGFLTECSAQNIFLIKDGRLFTPELDHILKGVTRAVIIDELAKELKIDCCETDSSMYDAYNADEIFIAATSFTMLPVSKLDNRPIGKSIPGPVTKRLIDAWSKLVGIDIVKQALHYAKRQGATH